MPLQPGYGQYPINKSIVISTQMNERIAQIAAARHVSHSEVIREALERGLQDD